MKTCHIIFDEDCLLLCLVLGYVNYLAIQKLFKSVITIALHFCWIAFYYYLKCPMVRKVII